jgi:spermidine/putrescine transport system ATP-binding protein
MATGAAKTTPLPDPPLLEVRGLQKEFGGVAVVAGIDLALHQGEFVTLLGPSGSGKTTTLRMIAGFEQPSAGEILLEGRDIQGMPSHRRPVNTVFQDYALFPHLSVDQNVAFGLKAQGVPGGEIEARVHEALEMVELHKLGGRSPSHLSGGQRQRAALARALVLRPRVLLLDEPLGALDLKLRRQMQLVLIDLCRQLGITFLYVTHDQEEALTMSDRIAVMNEGRIEQFAAPEELYNHPESAFVAGFVGDNNLLDVKVLGTDGHQCSVDLLGTRIVAPCRGLTGATAGQPAILAMRPESLTLVANPKDDGLVGTILQSVFIGAEARIVVRLADGRDIVARVPPSEARLLTRGSPVGVTQDAAALRVFPSAGGGA